MISKHISEKEATKSITALRLGIANTPNGTALANMKILAEKIFEPLRKFVGGPIKINSMFRSEALNKQIGGSSRSQHCQGNAMDIDDIYGYKTNKEMFDFTVIPPSSIVDALNKAAAMYSPANCPA